MQSVDYRKLPLEKLRKHLAEIVDDPERFARREVLAGIERLRFADRNAEHEKLVRVTRDHVRKALREVKKHFSNREHALELLVSCAIARVNLVYLGPPGTAKSLMVRTFAETLGVRPVSIPIEEADRIVDEIRKTGKPPLNERRLFEILLTRQSTLEETVGSANIDLLLDPSVHFRNTQGFLPQAEIAFIDEVFKANAAILNAMLAILNERLFYNAGAAFRVPLAFAVAASNEAPDGEELGALYDRFPLRVLCSPVPDHPDELVKMFDRAHSFRTGALDRAAGRVESDESGVARKACLNDLHLLARALPLWDFGGSSVFGDNHSFRDRFLDLFRTVRREFGLSDRSGYQLLLVARALAWIEGEEPAAELGSAHLRVFGHVANEPTLAPDLQRLVARQIETDSTPPRGGWFDAS